MSSAEAPGLYRKPPIERILTPFQEFLRRETSGGIILFLCTIAALIWANTRWSANYFGIWETKITIGAGELIISKSLLHWINDGLMAVFFFVVGLEIKREIIAGELNTIRKAALPVMAAIGGMIVPAIIYTAFNFGHEGRRGWGIPMATDIAFSLGVLQLLGRRVPLSLKVFLTAFAIVDDIGAVLVIAVFYTAHISTSALGAAAALLILAICFNALGLRRPLPYALLGIALWIAVLKSGVHATVAGVALAMAIPAWTRIAERDFLDEGRELLSSFESAGPLDIERGVNHERHAVINSLQQLAERVQTPVQRLEDDLHPWVTFFILPVFAFANAGVSFASAHAGGLVGRVSVGTAVGLIIGKLIGVSLFSFLAVRLGLAAFPSRVTARHIIGVAALGGIGFTMSLFVSGLAFSDERLLAEAKIGIFSASVIAGVLGSTILSTCKLPPDDRADTGEMA